MWLVIGYGSTLHSDDGFGPVVAEGVRARVSSAEVEVIAGTQLAPEWVEPIGRASGTIFVDASADLPPGQLQCVQLAKQGTVPVTGSTFTHYCTPETLLDGALTLYGHRPPAWLCAVGGATFALGGDLSPDVAAAVPRAIAHIVRKVAEDGPGHHA